MQHFGVRRFHTCALAGGKDDAGAFFLAHEINPSGIEWQYSEGCINAQFIAAHYII
jgi:hypothetical protein